MANKFAAQYKILGIPTPESTATPMEKADAIFQAACNKQGIDPALLPELSMLPEQFRAFPLSAYKLEVIRTALVEGKKANWNDTRERKWGSWWWMNDPGFRFFVSDYSITITYSACGSRLCTFSEEDEEFFALECIAIWADFAGAKLLE